LPGRRLKLLLNALLLRLLRRSLSALPAAAPVFSPGCMPKRASVVPALTLAAVSGTCATGGLNVPLLISVSNTSAASMGLGGSGSLPKRRPARSIDGTMSGALGTRSIIGISRRGKAATSSCTVRSKIWAIS
jgi:hypothetical protein